MIIRHPMSEDLSHLFHSILDAPIWGHFELVPASAPTSGNIFSFSEYLAALALLLVVLMASDFRYHYRLFLTRTNLRKVGFGVGLTVAVAILTIDIWFQNDLPIPKLLSNANNLKIVFAAAFLAYVFYVIRVAIISPPVFNKTNAEKFFEANYHLIHEGHADRMQIIAEELQRSVGNIIESAGKISSIDRGSRKVPQEMINAHSILLLFAEKRFCKLVVERVPAFALALLQEAQKRPKETVPIFAFVRNIGQEFIRNTDSSIYQEESVHKSGLLGWHKPVTKVLFGSYEFVEKCARSSASPLDIEYRVLQEFDEVQVKGFTRAALAFFESYLKETGGRYHSQAWGDLLRSFEGSVSRTDEMDGMEQYRNTKAYGHLSALVDFVVNAIAMVNEHGQRPKTFRTRDFRLKNISDDLAELIVEIIFGASMVSSPFWTSWIVQNNTVWSRIFGHTDGVAHRIIAFKVRRLLYDEIRLLDQFATFKGARFLGYCLNVLGLEVTDRHRGFRKEFYPLQAAAVGWAKANYGRILTEHPKVAEACLQGRISYDGESHCLVLTYADTTRTQPQREFLYLD